MFEYILAGVAACIIIFAMQILLQFFRKKNNVQHAPARKVFVNCPVCGSALAAGEDLYSKVFRPMTVSDQRCIVFGCPHCYPRCEPSVKRVCPVCHKTIPADGHLVARLFNKTKDGKKHVLITGCSMCCKYENIVK